MRATLIKNALVGGQRTDVLFDKTVRAVGTLDPENGVEIIEAERRTLLPGLHDHHIHLAALAAARRSVDVSPTRVGDEQKLNDLLVSFVGSELRGTGLDESVVGTFDRHRLDQIRSDIPVRLQHRSGKLWVMNSAALDEYGVSPAWGEGVELDKQGRPTGRLYRMDAMLRKAGSLDLSPVVDELLSFGITGVTDTTYTNDVAQVERLRETARPLKLRAMGDETVIGAQLKIVLDEDALPDIDALTARVDAAHDRGRGVAFHCVSRIELLVAMQALSVVGVHPDDRLEHGAVIAADLLDDLAELGCPVITQPGFIAHRGDRFLAETDVNEWDDLYRYRTLLDAGVNVVASSDAPYGPVNPWAVIAAATQRHTSAGEIVGRRECVSAEVALDGYLAPLANPATAPRAIEEGVAADLVLLARPIEDLVAQSGQSEHPAAAYTWVDGMLAFKQPS